MPNKNLGGIMNRGILIAVCITVTGLLSMWATPAFAYLGPGAGLAAIGAFLALVVGVIAAFLGFLWYPVKRFLRKRQSAKASPNTAPQTPHSEVVDKGA
jgi:hypothetical protein